MEKEQEILISIIIPVFNTPYKSLKGSIDSILAQHFYNYEIILVDDGSKDDCAKQLDQIAERDLRIKVIHQSNGGVSNARNTGIRVASAPYIAFVDADDVIAENFLEEAATYISEYSPDIIFGELEYVPGRNIKQNNGRVEEFKADNIEEVKSSLLGIKPRKLEYTVLGTPCARIYKTEHARNALFPEGVPLCEDQIFNRRILNEASKVLIVPHIWYYYIQNDFSAMHETMRRSYYKMAKPYWDELYAINSSEKEDIREHLRIMALGLYYTSLKKDYINKHIKLSQKIKEMREIAKHPLIQDAITGLQLTTKKLTVGQKLGLYLLKRKLFFLVYCCQCAKYRVMSGRG